MTKPKDRSRARRRAVSVGLSAVVAATALVAGAPVAQAAPTAVTGASFEWSVNNTIQVPWSGAVADGGANVACHYLSAGVDDGDQSSYADTYASSVGNVTILKQTGVDENGDPVVEEPTFANRCLRNAANRIEQKVLWSGGTGTVDPETGVASIAFTGTLTMRFNNWRSPVHVTNPVLTVDADGVGTLTATLSGYRTAQGSSERIPLDPVPNVVVANLSGVDGANTDGFTVTPDFFDVAVTVVNNFPNDPPTTITVPTAAIQAGKGAGNWGAWPESFTDFIYRTGLNSYFHSSNANPVNATDDNKAPTPLLVNYGTLAAEPPAPGDGQQQVVVEVPEFGEGEFVWSIPGAGAVVDLGEATNAGDHWLANGALLPVVVTDTRTGGPTWSVSGQVGDFTNGVSGQYLGWTPQVLTEGAGAVAGAVVDPGFPSGDGLKAASTLASATAGHAAGSATLGADLELRLPIATPAGTYSATLTITALS